MRIPEPKSSNRFLLEVEADIIAANREAISERLIRVTRTQFSALAKRVADLRADYLAAAFECNWTEDDLRQAQVRSKRELYQEALMAFEALERAVHRGYVEVC